VRKSFLAVSSRDACVFCDPSCVLDPFNVHAVDQNELLIFVGNTKVQSPSVVWRMKKTVSHRSRYLIEKGRTACCLGRCATTAYIRKSLGRVNP